MVAFSQPNQNSIKKINGKRQKTVDHVKGLILKYGLLHKSHVWVPPLKMLEQMADERLLQRDRLEIVVAYYAAYHGGNSPSFEEIHRWMGIAKTRAYSFGMELVVRRRAASENGRFWLLASTYTHPYVANDPILAATRQPPEAAFRLEDIADLLVKES